MNELHTYYNMGSIFNKGFEFVVRADIINSLRRNHFLHTIRHLIIRAVSQ